MVLNLRYENKPLSAKVYRKTEVEKLSLMEVVRQEMGVTEVASHPFIPQFYSIFEDDRFIIKITEHIQGECLYDSIREIGLLSTVDTQFYAASLVLLLEYFMSQ
jgi:cGMP-dependent protein kinase 1